MQRAVDDLASMLEKQIENYRKLKDLILEKRKAIVANDLKKLADATLQIEGLIGSNNQLEIGRMDLVKKLAAELKLSEPRPTLAHIAQCFEGPASEKLLELRRRATEAIRDVQRQNRINSEMLKYCAELLDSVLRRLVEAESCEPIYGSTGKAKKKIASASFLDHQM